MRSNLFFVPLSLAIVLAGPPSAWADTAEVSVSFTDPGWHMIALPLEPVNKLILVDPETREPDPESIFYDAHVGGNSPVNRLIRYQPGVGYWAYSPYIISACWFYLGMECATCEWCADYPPVGPWWQGLWFLVDVPHTLTYTAYLPPEEVEHRCLDISDSPAGWAWIMTGACARVPAPYHPDVTTWPTTSVVHDMMWGKSASCDQLPTEWWPSAVCPTGGDNDAWDRRYIGLPLAGYQAGAGYYTVSPSQGGSCGAPADTDALQPGEGYWLAVEDAGVWMRLQADQ